MAKSPLDVRLYRSSVKGRRPQPADMAYGDLAVNYNHEDPALIIKGDDNALIEFKPGAGSGVKVAAAAPANPKDGDLWWDTTSARLFLRYTSGTPAVSTWVDASPAAVPPALANALTYKGTVDPTAAASAPASPKVGDTYVASKAGTVDAGWTGLAGSSVSLHELLVWDGTEWDGAGTAATPRTPWHGQMDITAARPAGFTPVGGDEIQVSKAGTPHADWPGVKATAKVGDVYLYDGSKWQQQLSSAISWVSSTFGDKPDPARDLGIGDLGINVHHSEPTLFAKADDGTLLEWSPVPDYGDATAGDVLTMVVRNPPAGFEGTSVDTKFGIPDITHRSDLDLGVAMQALQRGMSFAIESGALTQQNAPSMGFVFSLHGYYYKVKGDLSGITDIHPSTWPANSYDRAPVTAEARWAQGLPPVTDSRPQALISEQHPPASMHVSHPINVRFGFDMLPPYNMPNGPALQQQFVDHLIAGKTPVMMPGSGSVNGAGVSPIGFIFNTWNNSFIQITGLPPAGTTSSAFFRGAKSWFKEFAPDVRWAAKTLDVDRQSVSAIKPVLKVADHTFISAITLNSERLDWVLKCDMFPDNSGSFSVTHPCNLAHGIPDVIALEFVNGQARALDILHRGKCFYVGIDGLPIEVNQSCAGFMFYFNHYYYKLPGPLPATVTSLRFTDTDKANIPGLVETHGEVHLSWVHPLSLLRNFGGLPPLP